ncbi:hypothetical protein ATANTOWER_017138 [Ataeniobius toweri]|uniref:Uncharacterized protein n=1 Tax=Ataeniobius toweri TaxID=208326 RepID=A0ABU7AR13_9TELE|nr:hypothetical protein [Ataeniobius toweri]
MVCPTLPPKWEKAEPAPVENKARVSGGLDRGGESGPPSGRGSLSWRRGASASRSRACAARETMSSRPKRGYQQKFVPVLENPQEHLGDQGEWGKGIEKGPGPLVHQCVAAQRTDTVHQGEPEGTVNRISRGKQVHLHSAEGRPNAIHHLWVKLPLPLKRHLPAKTESPQRRSADPEYRPP